MNKIRLNSEYYSEYYFGAPWNYCVKLNQVNAL